MEKQRGAMKVVGYRRVSTASQASEGESLNTQSQEIKDFAKKKWPKAFKLRPFLWDVPPGRATPWRLWLRYFKFKDTVASSL